MVDSFYVLDLHALQDVYHEWVTTLPDITPYYAVKCNPEQIILETLASLGSCFDCASPNEIERVLKIGVHPDRILYANPCKRLEDIEYAKRENITRTTFDSVCELKKIASVFPAMQLFLRIRADDPSARCTLGNKYGADEHEWDTLFFTARALQLEIVGISFHVGSFASSSSVFHHAMKKAEKALCMARTYGYDPSIIDIGGGFSSVHGLPRNLEVPEGVQLIAEPGRFFVERVMELHTPVIGSKGSGITISESLYGAFNCIVFDHYSPHIKEVRDDQGHTIVDCPITKKTIFGSTCDGGDVISKECEVPETIDYGYWIVWDNMGAYTKAATTQFNGIPFNERQVILV